MGGVGFWWRGWAACDLAGAARVSPAVGVNTSMLCVTPPKIIIRAWKGAVVVLSIFGGSKGKNSVTKVMCDAFGKERAVLVYYLAALSENCSSLRSDLWRSLGGFVGF